MNLSELIPESGISVPRATRLAPNSPEFSEALQNMSQYLQVLRGMGTPEHSLRGYAGSHENSGAWRSPFINRRIQMPQAHNFPGLTGRPKLREFYPSDQGGLSEIIESWR